MADEIVHIHGCGVAFRVVTVRRYLHKLTKEGTWQKRWFETNGCFLTYYKSKRMTKLLAALSLPQVGDIKLVVDSQDEGLFSITLHQRTYMLKAPTKADAERWVQTLLLLKNQPAEAPAAAASKPAEEAEWSKSQPRFCCCCRR